MTQFLREPALFPARIAGETWGAERFDLELAGETFRIEGLSALQLRGLEERYCHPERSEGPASERSSRPARPGPSLTLGMTTVQMFRAPDSDFLEIDTRGWEYWVDLDWTERGFALRGMRVMARVDERRAGIWTCVEAPDEVPGIVENVLRPLLASRLLATGGLLVHSASIDGYLFAGRSGAGKSTIARLGLAAGLPVLSDDLNAVVAANGAFTIAPLPFTGDLQERDRSHQSTALRAVLGLEKGDLERVRAATIAETVSLLVRCAPYVNQDTGRMASLLDRAAEIAGVAARGVVTFRRDGNVWPILEAGIHP
ncbi:MAG TPA: hypothetical protein VF215_09550 [Thermoanaerobaculia bacterium]